MEVNIHEAKTHLSRLVQRAQMGEEIIIAKAGKPLVRLVAITPLMPLLGSARGTVRMEEGWDSPLTDDEMEKTFGR